MPGWSAMPVGVQCTTPSLAGSNTASLSCEDVSTRASGLRADSSWASAVARSTSTSTTVRCSVPRRNSASPTAAPAPPAPISTTLSVAAPGRPSVNAEGETGGVGVVSDRLRPVEDDGVDRAELGRGFVDIVEVLDDQSLAGVGDVERVEAEGAGPVEYLADALGRDAQPRRGRWSGTRSRDPVRSPRPCAAPG